VRPEAGSIGYSWGRVELNGHRAEDCSDRGTTGGTRPEVIIDGHRDELGFGALQVRRRVLWSFLRADRRWY
jgi:hypothetical protein